MAEPKERGRAVPRWLAVASYPLGVLLLTLFFVYLGFPYDLLVARYTQPLEARTAMRVRVGDVEPHMSLFGPGVEVLDIQASRVGARMIAIDRVFVRPAWSFSWLTGSPAVHVSLTSEIGAGEGTITLGEPGGWQGELQGVEISALPLKDLLASFDVAGTLDASIELRGQGAENGGGLKGFVRFDVHSGSIAGPGLPIALPFETFGGDLRFGVEGSLVRIENTSLEGPILAATVEGEVGQSPVAGGQPLDIDVQYEIRDETIATMLGDPRGGASHIGIRGTLQNPIVK